MKSIDFVHYYGFEIIKPTKIIKLSMIQRIKRSLVNKNYKLLFVKQIEVPVISVLTMNVTT